MTLAHTVHDMSESTVSYFCTVGLELGLSERHEIGKLHGSNVARGLSPRGDEVSGVTVYESWVVCCCTSKLSPVDGR